MDRAIMQFVWVEEMRRPPEGLCSGALSPSLPAHYLASVFWLNESRRAERSRFDLHTGKEASSDNEDDINNINNRSADGSDSRTAGRGVSHENDVPPELKYCQLGPLC
ncbi:hypothetical protein EYF80_048434 [Liparis tanakae]|uniref:Uncharacterized protein n=1 Tax=Liparis tanakae TaxID=230148 RepID=A0A4Z2FJL3_9TELE|nr:hypothetical protein EYF80_048434 [Liparis tanakae]